MNGLYYSEVDSKRFSKTIHRGVLSSVEANDIRRYISDNKVDLLIVRIPVTLSEDLHKLTNIGFSAILADTLVYYYTNLQQSEIKEPKNQLIFEEVSDRNVHLIEQAIPEIFAEYTNHYTSNPSLDRTKITLGYIEWAKGFVKEKDRSKISWIVYKDKTPIGFATCSVNDSTSECEGVLYGVLPGFSGGGVYSDIIRFTQNYFKKQGISVMKVSTQIQNFAVQKVWAREGFVLKEAFYTFHISTS